MICLAIAIPALLTVVVVYGSSYQRTFCIGALFPTCTELYVTGWLLVGLTQIDAYGDAMEDFEEWLELFDSLGYSYRIYTAGSWLLAVIIGAAAVGVRRRLERGARGDTRET